MSTKEILHTHAFKEIGTQCYYTVDACKPKTTLKLLFTQNNLVAGTVSLFNYCGREGAQLQ